MRKKEIVWISVLLVLSGVYIHFFTHWFEKREIVINASLRPSRRPGGLVFPVVFALDDAYKLTSLKVLPMDGDRFDPQAIPVWHLVSDSNSPPIRAFRYGQPIQGMKSALKGVRPDPLKAGALYRLVLTSGNLSGNKDFRAKSSSE